MERTVIEGIDLNDPERFKRLEHHEMFRRLRAEDPVYWQPDELKGGGYWNVVKHADLIEVNRDTATFSSEVGGTMIMSGQFPDRRRPRHAVRHARLAHARHGSAEAHAVPAAREQGLHAAHDRAHRAGAAGTAPR